MDFLKKAFSGPPDKKTGTENYSNAEWENGKVLRPYWNKKTTNPRLNDTEYPRPAIMKDSQMALDADGKLWDQSKLYSGPAWEQASDKLPHGQIGGDDGSIDYVSLETAHDQSGDFHHENMNPYFKGTPNYVTERPIDDGIDYYKRNDIRNRPEMLKSQFEIRGADRETNLNRRMANMRADIEASVLPSRYKHDLQSIMPFDQLRDHTHNGKLYLEGEEPTAEDPLKPWYRPEEKTYEELFNRTTVDAPGRFEGGLLGEKLFYHQKIHHLKRKDVDNHQHWDYSAYSQAQGQINKEGARGNITGKRKNRILPDFEYFGNIGANIGKYVGRVEGFISGKQKNKGRGRDIKGTLLGTDANTNKGHTARSKQRSSKGNRKNVESFGGADKGMNKHNKDRIEHFNYTTWEPMNKREEKLFAIWNSRVEGNMQTSERGHNLTVTDGMYDDLRKNQKYEMVENYRPEGYTDTGMRRGMTHGAHADGSKTERKRRVAERASNLGQHDGNTNKGHSIRNDKGLAANLKDTFKGLYADTIGRLGNADNGKRSGMTRGKNDKKATRRSAFELTHRDVSGVEGMTNKGHETRGDIVNQKKNRKVFKHNGNLSFSGHEGSYRITEHEPRETLRSRMVSFVGNGFKDFGIMTHKGVNNIEWHKDRNRKMHTAVRGARNNGPQKQDLGWGADQVNLDMWTRKAQEIQGVTINPQFRSHHAPKYGGEGMVNRKGRNANRKVERSVHDGERAEFGFIKPFYDKQGRRRRRSRRTSRLAAKVKPAEL